MNLSVELAGDLIFVAAASDCHTNIYGGRGLLGWRDLSVSIGLVSRERKKKKAEKDRWCEIKRNSKGRSKIDRGRKEEKD